MNLEPYFKQAIDRHASDLHLVEGSVPSLRLFGELVKLDEEPIPYGELKFAIFDNIDDRTKERFLRKRDIDLSMDFYGCHFRVNLHFQKGKVGLTARLIPNHIPSPVDVDFNEAIYNLTHLKDGLVLVTGPTGSGKSTTLATMIDIINAERRAHIITIEDPIEFTFHDKQSIIEQRQIGRDTESFSEALKYSLRQDPNVIMVGELRDAETISAALLAATTGHLVLSTLHTSTAPETIERIINFFPTQARSQIAYQLASVLRAVIAQQLLPRKDGGLVAAREVLINNAAISNLIRHSQIEQIYNVIQTNREAGMMTMNKSIDEMLSRGLITTTVAKNRKRDMETMASYY